MSEHKPFWQTKTLAQMSRQEWESLCDGCARCCLLKLQDYGSDDVYYTNLHCQYLNREQCQCQHYDTRSTLVPDCVTLDIHNLDAINWMPSTCAYRLIAENKPLPSWHPLVSGSKESVHEAGISIRSFSVCETEVNVENHPLHIIDDFN